MSTNTDLLKRAYAMFPGASLGSFFLPAEGEFVVARGEGSHIYDMAGRAYIDYVMGSGPMILGHAHPEVVEAVQARMALGTTFYALNEPAILLAEKIVGASACAEAIKFTASGAEAVLSALRLARTATGRGKILKFEGGYHGHSDYAVMSVWPNEDVEFPAAVPGSAGIPPEVQESVLAAPFNNLDKVAEIVDRHHNDLAAVLVEPISRMVMPTEGFLKGLREITRDRGVLLIFDEVVSGFRIAWGGAQERYGVVPDLATYGKIVGGGLPLAAVAGRREIREHANPRDPASDYAYINGTLNGNALSATAGLKTLEVLERPGTYDRLRAAGDRMMAGLREITDRLDIAAQVPGEGPLVHIFFTEEPIIDYRATRRADNLLAHRLGAELLQRGVMVYMKAKMYISLAHSDADIDRTLEAFEDSLRAVLNSDSRVVAAQ